MKEIRVEHFTRRLECGATVNGFREIVFDPDFEEDRMSMDFLEEN